MYKNRNRGYQQLRVWADAIELYRQTSVLFRRFPYELKRVVSQKIASTDSIHRNIAEGYCRRSIKEYRQHLYVSLGSAGESVSGLMACHAAEQIDENEFVIQNDLAFKLENGLLRLVESLERKQESGEWIDHLVVKESNGVYTVTGEGDSEVPSLHHSNTPTLQTAGGSPL
ncbi:MAG: four helix bundle protein [bacterium]